jgi:hypothetical protein
MVHCSTLGWVYRSAKLTLVSSPAATSWRAVPQSRGRQLTPPIANQTAGGRERSETTLKSQMPAKLPARSIP